MQKYQLFELTTKPVTRAKLQEAVEQEVRTRLFDKPSPPIRLNRVVIGSILPPKPVLDQTAENIKRKRRERKLNDSVYADRAYREHLGLSAPEFVDLRRVEVQKEIVQHAPSALTIIMGMEKVGINLPPISGPQAFPQQ